MKTEEGGVPLFGCKAKLNKIIIFGLIAIQNNEGKWCGTRETKKGWYMPAGRVDCGESIETGTKREAHEESGIPVELTHVVRIDFSPSEETTRLRVIYKAKPTNEEIPLRDSSTADHEIIEAKWIHPKELEDGRELRKYEVIDIFHYLNKNPYLIHASIVQSSLNGFPIDHKKVIIDCVFSSTVILSDPQRKFYYLLNNNNNDDKGKEDEEKYDLIHYCMDTPRTFPKFIEEKFSENNCDIQLKGVIKLRFLPPHNDIPHRNVSHLNCVYFGITNDASHLESCDKIDIDQILNNNSPNCINNYNLELIKLTLNNETIYPLNIIDLEAAPLSQLSPIVAIDPNINNKNNNNINDLQEKKEQCFIVNENAVRI